MANGLQNGKREDTVRRILEGATSEFAREGFSGASVDDIARRAGVNKATIYYHIGDKQALYGQVLHHVIGGTVKRVSQNLEDKKTPRQKLETYIRGISETVDEHPPLPPVMMRAVASSGKSLPPEVAQDLVDIYGMLARILEEGVEKGDFMPSNALIIYIMILSSVALHKNVLETWAGEIPFPEMFKNIDSDLFMSVAQGLSGDAASEVIDLILRAVGTNGKSN